MISPARNAPRARDRPRLDVNHATERQMTIILRKNSSGSLVFVIWKSTCGTIHFALAKTRRIKPSPFAMIGIKAASDMEPACLKFPTFLQQFEHDGSTAQREKEANEDRFAYTVSKVVGNEKDSNNCKKDLNRASEYNRSFDLPEIFNGQLHTDSEQKKDDAHLRKYLHLFDGIYKTIAMGTYEYSGHKKTDNNGNVKAMT